MIQYRDITVVMQGDIRPTTCEAIESVRKVLPGAKLILSTFTSELVDQFVDLVDEVVTSPDPGPLPPFTIAIGAAPNNLNRQLVNTQAGLSKVITPYSLKMRTDCVLRADTFVRIYDEFTIVASCANRLVVSSFYTRHPSGLSCYLFHVSDWFVFGSARRVEQYCSVPLMSIEDGSWFDRHSHIKSSTYAARRFRARFTPEQHIAVSFARDLGYQTPTFLNETNETLVREYQRFLATEFVVAGPVQLGFELSKYPTIGESLYQRLDCVSFADWWSLYSKEQGVQPLPISLVPSDDSKLLYDMRRLANRWRHAVIRTFLEVGGVANFFCGLKAKFRLWHQT